VSYVDDQAEATAMNDFSTSTLLGALGRHLKNPVHWAAFVISVAIAFVLQDMFPGLPPLRKIDIGLIFISTFVIIEILWWFVKLVSRLVLRAVRSFTCRKIRSQSE
jgi:hypothetical protein